MHAGPSQTSRRSMTSCREHAVWGHPREPLSSALALHIGCRFPWWSTAAGVQDYPSPLKQTKTKFLNSVIYDELQLFETKHLLLKNIIN